MTYIQNDICPNTRVTKVLENKNSTSKDTTGKGYRNTFFLSKFNQAKNENEKNVQNT
jgi:hypothetical protein